jgi:hypothetical protein
LTHRRFVTPVAAIHMLPCWRSLVDLLPWKEKQRHSVHTDLILPFHVYMQHKFNVSHCPLTDYPWKSLLTPKMALDTLLGETKWLASFQCTTVPGPRLV